MASSLRIKRLEKLILQRASQVVLYELSDPRLTFVTLSRVKLSSDLSSALIFYSVLGTDADRSKATHALTDAAPHVQRDIAAALKTRRTPRVKFVFDESIEGAIRVSGILDELKRERLEREGDGEDEDAAWSDDEERADDTASGEDLRTQ